METFLYILALIFTTVLTIVFYSIGKNYINSEFRNWKNAVLITIVSGVYLFMLMFGRDPDTGLSVQFNLMYFLDIFIPIITALLIGLYFSNKKTLHKD